MTTNGWVRSHLGWSYMINGQQEWFFLENAAGEGVHKGIFLVINVNDLGIVPKGITYASSEEARRDIEALYSIDKFESRA